jgi:hypothetical protein
MSDKKSEYLKYMTERVVRYLDKSPDAIQSRQEKKRRREPWLTRWFGVVPMGLQMWWGSREKRKKKAQDEPGQVNSTNYR